MFVRVCGLLALPLADKTTLTYTYYENTHNVKTAKTQTGVLYEFTYDKWGNNLTVSIVSGTNKITSSAAYSTDGNRLVSTTDTVGNVTTYSYNANTNVLEWVQYPEDTEATRTEYTYDTMYRLATAEVTTDTGKTLSASYTYTNDLLTKITTPTTAYTFGYGNFSLRTSIKAGDHTLATYTYTNDQNNYLNKLAYGNGDSVQYTYDELGRVIRETYFEDNSSTVASTVTYKYDNNGALATVYDSSTGRTITYYYDFANRLAKVVTSTSDFSQAISYTFDETNNVTAMVEKVNSTTYRTTYAYDADNRISEVNFGRVKTNYSYDAFGRLDERVTSRDGVEIVSEEFTYNTGTGQVASLTTDAAHYDVTHTYTYDDNGNILTVSDGTNTTYYKYDSAGQLLREDNQAAGFTWVWEYDNAGNITSKTEYDYTRVADSELPSPDDEDVIHYGYDTESGWGDLLTSYGSTEQDTVSITYDAIGNPLSDGTWTYTWSQGRELKRMTDGTTAWAYTYDVNGMRLLRTNGTKTYWYLYNGDNLRQMTITGGVSLAIMYNADGPATISYCGTPYHYVLNLQGDVIALLDTSGNVVVEYTYDAWGKPLSITGSLASTLGQHNPLRYRGYVYDYETGLYYLQSRYYDPEMGRFLNADNYVSTGGMLGNNMFAYCLNNPINFIDRTGQEPDDYSGGVGEDLGELIYEWLTGEEHPSKEAEKLESEIKQKQNELIRKGAKALWDAYVHSIELEAEAQYQQDIAVKAFVEDRFSTPEKAANSFGAIACVLEGASLATQAYPAVSTFFAVSAWVVGGIAVAINISAEE